MTNLLLDLKGILPDDICDLVVKFVTITGDPKAKWLFNPRPFFSIKNSPTFTGYEFWDLEGAQSTLLQMTGVILRKKDWIRSTVFRTFDMDTVRVFKDWHETILKHYLGGPCYVCKCFDVMDDKQLFVDVSMSCDEKLFENINTMEPITIVFRYANHFSQSDGLLIIWLCVDILKH